MIELLFVTCLSTAPDHCQERSLLFQDVSAATCMMGAQPQLAKWVEAHPRFTVSRWTCRSWRADRKDA